MQHALGMARDQPFTPPAVTPAMIFSDRKKEQSDQVNDSHRTGNQNRVLVLLLRL